jgi:periplasmic copper chaperone A
VTLVVEGKDGKRQNIEIKASARMAAAPAMKHGDGKMHKH